MKNALCVDILKRLQLYRNAKEDVEIMKDYGCVYYVGFLDVLVFKNKKTVNLSRLDVVKLTMKLRNMYMQLI